MALARRKDMDDNHTVVSEEARRRIDSARVRQLAFKIKTSADDLSDDDAEMVATILLEMFEASTKPSADTVRQTLIERGRSRSAAERIVASLGF
jgi:hypothetical protein